MSREEIERLVDAVILTCVRGKYGRDKALSKSAIMSAIDRALQEQADRIAELEKQLRHASLWSQELDDERRALQSRLATVEGALRNVNEWITNWSPDFTDDPEWPSTRSRIDAALGDSTKGEP